MVCIYVHVIVEVTGKISARVNLVQVVLSAVLLKRLFNKSRTIRLAKEVGLTDEIIDDLLVNGDRDKYLLTGVNKYE